MPRIADTLGSRKVAENQAALCKKDLLKGLLVANSAKAALIRIAEVVVDDRLPSGQVRGLLFLSRPWAARAAVRATACNG